MDRVESERIHRGRARSASDGRLGAPGRVAFVRCRDADVLVYLQRSQFDETVFVNVGVALHDLGRRDSLKLRRRALEGRLSGGLVRKEAREIIAGRA
jgi:hypothetical protein